MNYPNSPNSQSGLGTWLKRQNDAANGNRVVAGRGMRAKRTTQGIVLESFGHKRNQTWSHPFKVFEVSEDQKADADKGKICFAVRSGVIEVRPNWTDSLNAAALTIIAPQNFAIYQPGGVDHSDDVSRGTDPVGRFGFSGEYFALDDISGVADEVSGGTSYGCYYSIWIETNDNTPNASPTVEFKCRRFSPKNPGVTWPIAFPATEFISASDFGISKEIIPVAIIQVNHGNALAPDDGIVRNSNGIGEADTTSANHEVVQLLHDNLVNRWRADSWRMLGEFNTAHYRTYYPGDTVVFYGSGGTDANAGLYTAYGYGANGGAVLVPTDNALAIFTYIGNINPPSITNPP